MKAWKIVPVLILVAFIIFISFSSNSVPEKTRGTGPTLEVPEEFKSLPNPVLADEASLIEGGRLYSVYCDTCHGKTGSSGESITENFEIPPTPLSNVEGYTDGELFYFTSKGVEGSNMMAFEYFLTKDQMWHFVNYMKVLPTKTSLVDKIKDFFS